MVVEPCLPAQHEIYCLAPAYREISELSGFLIEVGPNGEPVSIDATKAAALGVRVEMVATDLRMEVDRTQLHSVCHNDACVVYRVSCEPLICTWEVARQTGGTEQLSRLRLTATSSDALNAARSNIYAAADATRGVFIPLSDLQNSAASIVDSGTYLGSPDEPF